VETLHISSLFEKSCNAFPITCSVLVDELLELLVLLRSPPTLSDSVAIFDIVSLKTLHFGDDITDKVFAFLSLVRVVLTIVILTALFVELFEGTLQNLLVERV
jgi:hypothetical protein